MLHEAHKELQQKKMPCLPLSLITYLKTEFLPSLQILEFLAKMFVYYAGGPCCKKTQKTTVILWNPTCIRVAMRDE